MIKWKCLSQTQAVTRLDAKTEGGKGTGKKICFKYPRLLSWAVVQEIPLASNSSFTEEEACGGNLHIKVASHCGESKTL